MSIYMQATIEPRGGGQARLLAALADLVVVMEEQGWRLAGAFIQRSGRLHTIIDLWELDDYGHYERGLSALRADPRFPAIAQVLTETILNETVVFCEQAPYMHKTS